MQRLERRCETQKVCHDTYAQALDACEDQMLAGRVAPGCHLVPYLCNTCNRWHVGNKVIVHIPGARMRGPMESKR